MPGFAALKRIVFQSGFETGDPLPSDDPAQILARRTRLACAVTGNFGDPASPLTAVTEVGEVSRIQAYNIDAAIRANRQGGRLVSFSDRGEIFDSEAMEEVRATNRLSGQLIAGNAVVNASETNPAWAGTWAADAGTILNPAEFRHNIQRIRVGPLPIQDGIDGAEGIKADIIARQGRIASILTTGPIGTPAAHSRIQAGRGIFEIRMLDEATAESGSNIFRGNKEDQEVMPLAVNFDGQQFRHDFHIDLRADLQPPDASPTDPLYRYRTGVGIVDTRGSYIGSFAAKYITYRVPARREWINQNYKQGLLTYGLDQTLGTIGDGESGEFIGMGGLLIRGEIDAPIHLTHGLSSSSIIAQTIRQPITIGGFVQGMIVAFAAPSQTDPGAGCIPSIEVGFGGNEVEALNEPRGLLGSECPAVVMPLPHWAATWFRPINAGDELPVRATADCLIRANAIANVKIYQVKLGGPAEVTSGNKWPPRIEARRIDTLQVGNYSGNIGTMNVGVIWSGNLEYAYGLNNENQPVLIPDTNRPWLPKTQDRIDDVAPFDVTDYADIGSVNIRCMGPSASLWYKGCPDARIAYDALGLIHVPRLPCGHRLTIGGRFGAGSGTVTASGCETDPLFSMPSSLECSPRGIYCRPISIENEPYFRAVDVPDTFGAARLRVHEDFGLQGQVLIHANHTGVARVDPEYWGGEFSVGTLTDGDPGNLIIDDRRYKINLGESDLDLDTAPFFARPTSDLGGGSASLCPPAIHRHECDPPYRSTTSGQNITPKVWGAEMWGPPGALRPGRATGMVFVFYGPVKQRLPVETPRRPLLRVERLSYDSNNQEVWTDFTSLFEFALEPGDDQTMNRRVRMRCFCQPSTLPPGGTYRVRQHFDPGQSPVGSLADVQLLGAWMISDPMLGTIDPFTLADVARNDGNVLRSMDTTYVFDFGYSDPADVASLGGQPPGDGAHTPDDIIYFLNAFFALNPVVADITKLGGQGLEPDGEVTVDDLVVFLDYFFRPIVTPAPCPNCDPAFNTLACPSEEADPCNPPMGMMMSGGGSGGSGGAMMPGQQAAPAAADDDAAQAIPMPATTRDQLVISRAMIQSIAAALPPSQQRTQLLQQLQQLDARINAIPVSTPGGPGQ